MDGAKAFTYFATDRSEPIYTERRLDNQVSHVTTTILAAALCSVLLSLARFLSVNKSRVVADLDAYRSFDRLVFRFHEVYRSVLDPKALTFLAKNAPAYAITSYRMRQQQLAQLSLRVVRDTVLHSMADRSGFESALSIRHAVESSISKAKASFLLLVCFVGHVGLWIFQCLSSGIPRRVQLWLPAKVLSAVGAAVSYVSHDLRETTVAPGRVSEMNTPSTASRGDGSEGPVTDELRGALGRVLPNDISRMIYIATLRDNNTGGYFHPDLARRFTLWTADRAMLVCHQEIYERLVSLELEDLTDQLDVYFRSILGPRVRSIENWRKLRAYRATIPIHADPISAEVLFMKIDVALAILEARLPARTE